MTIEIKVPTLPESVTDAVIAKWYKKVGDTITRDENLVDLETDKVMLEVPAPRSGVIEKIIVQEGSVVKAQELLAIIREESVSVSVSEKTTEKPVQTPTPIVTPTHTPTVTDTHTAALSPSERRAIGEGKALPSATQAELSTPRTEKRVAMSRLRLKVAERLKDVQNTAAILTTFNEINMKPVMDLRNRYKDEFEKATGSRLGFMSFFTKAAIEALKQFPAVNASIDGSDILYHNYYDIGIAIGSERGLVVPVIRNADQVSMAGIEKQIRDFAKKAGDGKIAMEDLMGGTFTITNAGTYGSMMSTPIINPPQSAILGMHNIVERAVVENNQIVIRPMMYVALSYDHRIIDGREAVLFLMTVKKLIEDPARFLLQI
jgi:2-oxoglutarate dehydrogenase E2 component (dihydrolipoamide succinyltransferase)